MKMRILLHATLVCTACALASRDVLAQQSTANYSYTATSPPRASVPWQTWGRSLEDRPIDIARLGSGPEQVLVVAGLRGDDTLSVELAGRLAAHLADFPTLLETSTVTIVRDANPDGRVDRGLGNARGVELDHNFSASNWRKLVQSGEFRSGQLPDSEPETRALAELVEQLRPDRVVVLEVGRGAPTVTYTQSAADWAGKLASELRAQTVALDLAGASGSLVVFAAHDRGASGVVVSLPRARDAEQAWLRTRSMLAAAVVVEHETPPPVSVPAAPATASEPESIAAPGQDPAATTTVSTRTSSGDNVQTGGRPFSFLNRGARDVISAEKLQLNRAPVHSAEPPTPKFEQSKSGTALHAIRPADEAGGQRVLSADELSKDGKLVPIVMPQNASSLQPPIALPVSDDRSEASAVSNSAESAPLDAPQPRTKLDSEPVAKGARTKVSRRELAQPAIPLTQP